MNIKNANMFQKSLIQQINEAHSLKGSFKRTINDLMEQYTINGNVFGVYNGSVVEVKEGYFEIINTYNTLNEAIDSISSTNQFIRIIENETFQVGLVNKLFSDCEEGRTIINLDTQTEV